MKKCTPTYTYTYLVDICYTCNFARSNQLIARALRPQGGRLYVHAIVNGNPNASSYIFLGLCLCLVPSASSPLPVMGLRSQISLLPLIGLCSPCSVCPAPAPISLPPSSIRCSFSPENRVYSNVQCRIAADSITLPGGFASLKDHYVNPSIAASLSLPFPSLPFPFLSFPFLPLFFSFLSFPFLSFPFPIPLPPSSFSFDFSPL